MRSATRRRAQLPQLPEPRFDYLIFDGGLDQETPSWQAPVGSVRDSQNYERAINGGYSDIQGYERFDGQAAPSAAGYTILDVTITGSIEVGDTVTGVTSTATGKVIAVDTTTRAPQTYLVLTKVTGTFDESNETLNVSAAPEGNTDDVGRPDGASTTLLHAQYVNLAADSYRADIAAVPGEESILGVFVLGSTKYAWRNATGGATADMYKSTAAGWAQVTLSRTLAFTSGGTTEIAEGDTITGATGGATAVVGRVILSSGSWAGADAAGTLYLNGQVGTFQAENLDVGASLNVATIAGNSSATTMSPSGRFEVVISKDFAPAEADRAYGVDGVNKGWEFDGTTFVKITTGMATDTPTHVRVHKKHLFYSFVGSVQHSGIGTQYVWSPVLGASEISVGDTITGFSTEPGSAGDAALGVFTRNRLHILYGNSSSDWNLVPYREEIGAIAHTIQTVAYTMFLDDRGITSLRTAQEFGNFQHATLSNRIQSFIKSHRSTAVASCIARDKNQYRIFFSDSYALYVTMNGNKVAAMMPCLFVDDVTCIASVENTSGQEEIYFGSSDGFVYQLDKGTSFDGDAITAYLYFHHHYAKSLGYEKKWLSAVLEAKGTGYAAFDFSFELNYGDSLTAQPTPETITLEYSSVYWDQFTWDQFIWDGRTLGPTRAKLGGDSETIALVIRKSSDYYTPVLLTGARLRHTVRRQIR